MAQAPRLKRLFKEDFPESPDWFSRYLETTNPFFGDVSEALGQGLDRKNSKIQTEKVRIETQKNPSDYFANGKFQIKNKLGRPPVEVRISQITRVEVPTYQVGIPHYPTLETGWLNYQLTDATLERPGFMQHATGRVHLFGLASGGVPGGASIIMTLPAQMSPPLRHVFPVISNGALGRCDVLASGQVIAFAGSGVWFSLDGVSIMPWTLTDPVVASPYSPGAAPYTLYNPLAPESWESTQSGTIKINNIPGLAPNTKYEITITLE